MLNQWARDSSSVYNRYNAIQTDLEKAKQIITIFAENNRNSRESCKIVRIHLGSNEAIRTSDQIQESCRSTAKERDKESEAIPEDVYHAAG